VNHIWSRIALVAFSFFIGLAVIRFSDRHFQQQRDPAAIRQVFDFSRLRGSALEIAVKERLISGLDIYKSEQGFGLSLGHFAFQKENGEKTLGCQHFSKVAVVFEAEGYAVSGNKTTLEIEGGCEYSSDLAKINPLVIPMARILSERPADGDFNFQEGTPVSLRFLNVPEAWPRKWVLIGVRIEGEGQSISVDRNEVAQILGHPLMINF